MIYSLKTKKNKVQIVLILDLEVTVTGVDKLSALKKMDIKVPFIYLIS